MRIRFLKVSRGEYAAKMSIPFGLAIVGALLSLFFPFHLLGSPCTFKVATGEPCPFCGMTRAFVHVFHLRFGEAFRMNPLGAVLCLAMIAGIIATASGYRFPWWVKIERTRRETLALVLVFVVIVVINWAWIMAFGAA